MLNAAVRSLGHYEDISAKRCPKDGLFKDPENCSAFYSCVKGNTSNYSEIVKVEFIRHSMITEFMRFFFFLRRAASWSLRPQPAL